MKLSQYGMTLIELMVALVIVAILSAIAYPSYTASIQKSHRSDAKVSLNEYANRLQRCYTTNGAYVSNNQTPLNCAPMSELTGGNAVSMGGLYKLSISNVTTNNYLVTATADSTKAQAKDTLCQKFTLDQTGIKNAYSSTGDSSTDACW